MKKKFLAKRLLAIALSATMTATMVPTSVFAVTGSQVAMDGTYESDTVQVVQNEKAKNNEDSWKEYSITAKVIVSDGKFSDITVNTGSGYDPGNDSYFTKATTGDNGVVTKLKGKAATQASVDELVDAVSNATCTRVAVKSAIKNALSKASEVANKTELASAITAAEKLTQGSYTDDSWTSFQSALTNAKAVNENAKATQSEVDAAKTSLTTAQGNLTLDEYVYGYAGLTWAEYWANESVYKATNTSSSDELDSKGETDKGGFDVVTRATTNHGLHRGSFQCITTIYCTDGTSYGLASWASDGKSFVTTGGKTVGYSKGTLTTDDGKTHTLSNYKVYGLKYVPVKVKSSDLDAFKAKYTFVENGSTLAGGYSENKLNAYSVTAAVDSKTNGLKTVTKNGDSFSFSAAAAGTTSGIKDQALKTVDSSKVKTNVKDGDGSYGEFLRVDLEGEYGDLGSNLQSVTWTYYGNDSTRSNALRTYGTKFAADNWMHKSMSIQLGLTDSVRCQLPEGTDGTGYWSITVHALGYADYTTNFEVKTENIAVPKPATKANVESLQALYDKGVALIKGNYSTNSWNSFETELKETKELLDKKGNVKDEVSKDKSGNEIHTYTYPDITNAAVLTQIQHLQSAIDALVRTAPSAGDYILMNIPYDEFYKAELSNNDTKVDVFTSATINKTRTGSLAGGSYHKLTNKTNADGTTSIEKSEILGITYWVYVTEDAADKIDWSKYTQIKDSDKLDITVTNRGQTSTTTYIGKDALFEADTYSYYILGSKDELGDAVPANYKELTLGTDNAFAFSKVKGADAKVINESEAELSTSSSYGDYELDLSESTKNAIGSDATVYGVVINTKEGTSYGLRHLENIWRMTDLAWCSTTRIEKVHNCPTSYEHYASLMGQSITSLTYYTSNGIFDVQLNNAIKVPVKVKGSQVSIAGANLSDANAKVSVSVTVPSDYAYADSLASALSKQGFTLGSLSSTSVADANGNVTYKYDNVAVNRLSVTNGKYSVTVSDKNDKYADETASFIMSTDNVSVEYNGSHRTPALVAKDGAASNALSKYVGYITNVNVNGKDYSASGRGATKLFNNDGTLITSAKPFAEGNEFEITVTADSYNTPVTLKYVKAADYSALETAIADAEALVESDYTVASWAAAKDSIAEALASAKETDADTDYAYNEQKNVDEVTTALTDALALLAKVADKTALETAISAAEALTESDYTDSSWKTLAAALDSAKKAFAADYSVDDQSKVDAVTDALNKAIAALEKPKAAETSTTTTSTSTDATKTVKTPTKVTKTNDTNSVLVFSAVAGAAALLAIAELLRRKKFSK